MFLLAMSLIIAISVTVVGVLLIFALLVTPAATAIRLTARPTLVIAIASGIALVSVWGGLIVATLPAVAAEFRHHDHRLRCVDCPSAS